MSKKITHKEHRQLLSELYKKQGGKWIYQADAYIKQQEKREKLLELYITLFKASGLDLFDTELVRQIKEQENDK